jgi:hypothetical protein
MTQKKQQAGKSESRLDVILQLTSPADYKFWELITSIFAKERRHHEKTGKT